MRPLLARHAVVLYLAGAAATVVGFAVVLYASATVGACVAGAGYLAMAITHDRVGA